MFDSNPQILPCPTKGIFVFIRLSLMGPSLSFFFNFQSLLDGLDKLTQKKFHQFDEYNLEPTIQTWFADLGWCKNCIEYTKKIGIERWKMIEKLEI